MPAASIFGGNIFYLSTLIISSKYNYDVNKSYALNNIFTLIALVAGLAISSIYNIEGLRNTAIVYSVLWSIEKYHEIYYTYLKDAWIFIFTLSLMSYFIAIYIH